MFILFQYIRHIYTINNRFLIIKIYDLFEIKTVKRQITAYPPSLTAKAWALFDGSSGKLIDGKCVHN